MLLGSYTPNLATQSQNSIVCLDLIVNVRFLNFTNMFIPYVIPLKSCLLFFINMCFFFLIILLYWGYIMTFTKVLTMCHSLIHPPEWRVFYLFPYLLYVLSPCHVTQVVTCFRSMSFFLNVGTYKSKIPFLKLSILYPTCSGSYCFHLNLIMWCF
jgi:hypothetical protein